MIRIGTGLLVALLISAAPGLAWAGAEQNWTLCSGDDAAAAITACTDLIDNGHLSKAELAEAYYYRGFADYNQSHYDLAIADYSQAIVFDPKDEEAYVNRGVAYNQKGEYDLAIADYTMALQLNPRDVPAYSDRGAAYGHKKAYDLAVADYTAALKLAPDFAPAYTDRAGIYTITGHPDLALADLTQALKFDPTSPDAYTSRGMAYAQMGNDDMAIADFTRAIALDPKYAKAYLARGRSEFIKGQYDLAMADDTQLIALKPDGWEGYFARAYLYARAGKSDLAIADYTKAIALNPSSPDAYVDRAYVYAGTGKPDLALADDSKALALDPQNALAYAGKGQVLAAQKDYAGALAAFGQAIDLQPQAADFHLERAQAYLLQKDYPDARADAEAELKIAPANPMPATYLLINIDLAQGNTADALALARDLVARFPNDSGTHVELGQLLGCLVGGLAPCTPDRPAAFAEFSQAITLHPTPFAYAMRSQARPLSDAAGRHADLDAALAIDPNDTIALLTRSALYLYEHDDAKGLADADTVLARTPADLQALNLRAKLLGQLKRYDEEMKALDAELKLNPDNADALNSQCWSRAVRNVELDTALDNCNAAIRLSPIANYYDSRALVYRRLGRLDDALADYNAALAKTPDLAGSLYGRGLIEIIKGQAEAGRADIAKAMAIRPQAGDAFKEMGLAPDQPAGAAAKP